MKLKSGRVVHDLDGLVSIGPEANEIRYGYDGCITRDGETHGEYWDTPTEAELDADIDFPPVTQAERAEIAEIMIERWRRWAALRPGEK